MRRQEIIDALRRGTVPRSGLDVMAVGMERFSSALDQELDHVARGGGAFKAVRGEYGSGKTFFGRWLQERARSKGFASSEVQISETQTPLHRMETVYRRLVERLATSETQEGALRSLVDAWFFTLERDVLADRSLAPDDVEALIERTERLMEQRLALVCRTAPAFAAVLRTYRRALHADDAPLAEGLIAWLGGQPNVAVAIKRKAGIKGEIDHYGASSFLVGLLTILRDAGYAGLVLVLDEAETLQRMRADARERGLNAIRQLVDEIDGGRFPGLALILTGTPAFFDGHQGVQRLPPLAQRLAVSFGADSKFDNPRAVQIKLPGFDLDALIALGRQVRDIYAEGSTAQHRIRSRVGEQAIEGLARSLVGSLGGRVGVAPRLFLKKLVAELLDRVDLYPDFDPAEHFTLDLSEAEMTASERAGLAVSSLDDIELPP